MSCISNHETIAEAANGLRDTCHELARTSGWWTDLETGEVYSRGDVPQALTALKLLLVHAEISEAVEGLRKGLMDDKLPHRSMLEVELADAAIRLFDLTGALGFDIGGAIAEKLAYNQKRVDHTIEHRRGAGGKTF